MKVDFWTNNLFKGYHKFEFILGAYRYNEIVSSLNVKYDVHVLTLLNIEFVWRVRKD